MTIFKLCRYCANEWYVLHIIKFLVTYPFSHLLFLTMMKL